MEESFLSSLLAHNYCHNLSYNELYNMNHLLNKKLKFVICNKESFESPLYQILFKFNLI